MIQDYYRGDIFFITSAPVAGSMNGGCRPAVIASNDTANKYSPQVEVVFLTTQEKKPMPTHVPVMCKVPSTALCENIQTVSKERIDGFVRSCTAEEMKKIDTALLCSLGLRIVDEFPNEVNPAPDPTADVMCREEIERDLYKNLYESLLEKLMNK